ncbi:aldose 1-epimerase [Pullulanibacillus camelliae]|uniref:Aldose 1-epimerase n=1 Tax=Pullulanibacillus camelliae TaxID=1707096 RepID=A0A8J2VJJ8_9BACL|nr:aldose epimerase family protein [Pullulanibacillus camelliae]GGE25959.1 aldose 1-epimerase [Pullulanibacillus camelliae]
MKVLQEEFGQVDGKQVYQYTLVNEQGMRLSCLDYGCIITELFAPDREGNFENVVLGFDSIEDYLTHSPYFGAIVGRVAGRIAESEFELNGRRFALPKNEGQNHLHGGPRGFSHVIWDAAIIEGENESGIQFSYVSPDGEEGYPGTLQVKVTYTLNQANQLKIRYHATTDQTTLVNLTNHSYFNLSGDLKRNVLEHTLTMDSKQFFELDEALLPTGKLLNVEGTPFDFRSGRKIADGITSSHPQNVLVGQGYDHPFLLNKQQSQEMVLSDPESGRQLIVATEEPSVVLYTSNTMEDTFKIRGTQSGKYMGVCLETQGPPDAIHHPNFKQCTLEAGQVYQTETTYTFNGVK